MANESLKRARARQKWMNDQLQRVRLGHGYVSRRVHYAKLRIMWDRMQSENRANT